MRVLFLTQRLPYAPNRGDRVRAFHLLRFLRTFAEVDVVSFVHDDDEAAHAGDLAPAAEVDVVRIPRFRNHLLALPRLGSQTPLTHLLLDAPEMRGVLKTKVAREPDVVLAFGSGMARFALEPPLLGIPLVLDMVDADSAKWEALGAKSGLPMSWVYRREARCLGAFERRATASAFATTVVNERERDVLRRIAPEGAIEVVPNGVDVEGLMPAGPPGTSTDVVLCGVMNYPPNEAAAIWLASSVWPLVRKQVPAARLMLVGASPTKRVQHLGTADGSIVVTGAVPEVTPYLWAGAVSAAPLFTARGVQNKVLEAVAAGLPAVVTPAVAEGLPAPVLQACTVADTAEAFAAQLVAGLHRTPEARRAVAARADLRGLSWGGCLAPFRELIETAAGSGNRGLGRL